MENFTFNANILLMEGLKVSPSSSVPAFILLLLIYIFIMVSNIGLVVLISMERSLHEPMYLLLCNMSINDVFGATTIIPRILSDVFTPMSQRYIPYISCAIQAFFGAWVAALIFVTILLGLTFRLTICRQTIMNPFCDNPSLFKLSCQNLLINNIYGLGMAVVILGSSLCSITFTYLRIAMVCLRSKNKAQISKALQTCVSHLAVFLILLFSGGIISTLHRFPNLSDERKFASIMFHVVPPSMNAVIYGLQIKAVRQKMMILFKRNNVF
ncbi:olfactory receptor 8I2-like [Labrus mixtus]|uniref:olfactory receptor 8I2-like n=1 Tax=Labrus mixtus TaxID=508554 RepID=UPI0029C0513D|nr:olfactory receptor 8I2-like [Labrus mixtus]